MHLYINIPFVYTSLIKIFENLKEEELAHLCRSNVNILQDFRWKEVSEIPSSGRIDSVGYANLFTLVKNDLKASLKSHNYVEANQTLHLAFDLLSYDVLKNKSRSDGLSLDPTLTSVLDMFGLLSKY